MLDDAKKIATHDLRANYGKLGIYAGPRNYKEYWCRDGAIASLGSCILGDFDQVRKNLDLFIKYQGLDGHLPTRVEERVHGLGLLGFDCYYSQPKARHKSSQPWATQAFDTNPWFLIAVNNYINTSHDFTWFQQNEENICKIADWIVQKIDKNGLVKEGVIANWNDATFRSGYIAYTNILCWYALKITGEELRDKRYLDVADELKKIIIINFWNEKLGYFIDWIGPNGKRYLHFATDGNLLAIFFDIVRNKEKMRILKYIDEHKNKFALIPTYFGKTAWWNDLLNRIIFSNYKTTNIYTFWTCILAVCRFKIGDLQKGRQELLNIAKVIISNQTCPEVLDNRGQPVNLWWYHSEKQISWTAGTYIYALAVASWQI